MKKEKKLTKTEKLMFIMTIFRGERKMHEQKFK